MNNNPSRRDRDRDRNRDRDRDYYANPGFLLVCANGECGLSLPIRLPQYNQRCPRCGIVMNPVRIN